MLHHDMLDEKQFDGRKRGVHRRKFGTDYVESRFIEAAATLHKLPPEAGRGYATLRMDVVNDF